MYILIVILSVIVIWVLWFCLSRDDEGGYVTPADIERNKLEWAKHLAHMEKLGIDTDNRKNRR